MKVIMILHENLPAKGLSYEGIMHGISVLEGLLFLCVLLSDPVVYLLLVTLCIERLDESEL